MTPVAASAISETAAPRMGEPSRWRAYLDRLVLGALAIGILAATLLWNAMLVGTVMWLVWS
jgi:hypothetical protein